MRVLLHVLQQRARNKSRAAGVFDRESVRSPLLLKK